MKVSWRKNEPSCLGLGGGGKVLEATTMVFVALPPGPLRFRSSSHIMSARKGGERQMLPLLGRICEQSIRHGYA